jgi:hypothetical protein
VLTSVDLIRRWQLEATGNRPTAVFTEGQGIDVKPAWIQIAIRRCILLRFCIPFRCKQRDWFFYLIYFDLSSFLGIGRLKLKEEKSRRGRSRGQLQANAQAFWRRNSFWSSSVQEKINNLLDLQVCCSFI